MTTRFKPPTLKLESVLELRNNKNLPGLPCCHIYGIFGHKESHTGKEHWFLLDDTCSRISIRLMGNIEDYPKPKYGDIVRVHRLSFDRQTHHPYIPNGRNVVIWKGFKEDPTPITKAQDPTIEEADTRRRKELEIHLESFIMPTNELTKRRHDEHLTVAGQIEDITKDQYGNHRFEFRDGAGRFKLRVFTKTKEKDTNEHFETASKFVKGDLFIANSVKLDKSTTLVDLSANESQARSICQIEPNSYLGRKLDRAIEARAELSSQKRPPPTEADTPPVRRSRRLAQLSNNNNNNDIINNNNISSTTSDQEQVEQQQLPNFTYACDIKMKDSNAYEFYDLVGQVRGHPNETKKYHNYVFQLYDASKPDYVSYYANELTEEEPGCVTILVFSKQEERDTDQHIKKVKTLKSGDLVYVTNVKAAWKDGKLKLMMNPNTSHGKCITVLDKLADKFGEAIDNIVSNPITPEETFHDAAFDISTQESCNISEQNSTTND